MPDEPYVPPHPLIHAIVNGPNDTRLARVRECLREHRGLVTQPDSHGDLPVNVAIASGVWRVAAAIARADAQRSTPLHNAYEILVGCIGEWSQERTAAGWFDDVEHHLWARVSGRLPDTPNAELFAYIDGDSLRDLEEFASECDAWPAADGDGVVHRVPLAEWRERHADWRARHELNARQVRGVVVDRDWRPVADALVHLNCEDTRTAADGSFVLTLSDERNYVGWPNLVIDELHALARDGRYAIVPHVQSASAQTLRVVLDAAMTSICGTVVDEQGALMEGAEVSIERGEFFGWIQGPCGRMAVRWQDAALDGWFHYPTDALGRFWVPGFLGRTYDVHALANEPLRQVVARAVAAGVDGKFELRDVPRAWLDAGVYGDGFSSVHERLEPVPTTIELVVARLCPLRIRARDESSVPCRVSGAGDETFARRNAAGERLGGTGTLWITSLEPTGTLWLPETVDALIVVSDDENDEPIERRVPIRLDPRRTIEVEV